MARCHRPANKKWAADDDPGRLRLATDLRCVGNVCPFSIKAEALAADRSPASGVFRSHEAYFGRALLAERATYSGSGGWISADGRGRELWRLARLEVPRPVHVRRASLLLDCLGSGRRLLPRQPAGPSTENARFHS